MPLDKVGDEAFAIGALGEGIAIEPSTDTLTAPCDGTVTVASANQGATVNAGDPLFCIG